MTRLGFNRRVVFVTSAGHPQGSDADPLGKAGVWCYDHPNSVTGSVELDRATADGRSYIRARESDLWPEQDIAGLRAAIANYDHESGQS